MSEVRSQENAVPALVAGSIIVGGVTAGHFLIGICFAAVAFLGLALRAQPRTRIVGSLLFLAVVLGFASAILFTTGLSLGKNMAIRDAAHAQGSLGTFVQ
ncbi:hypothetical protein PY254_01875 [Rhodanobacter sp. AS-Z3]|uniref:hypothetical protein n=1 Tax=Rhodanobacter sp. AS-Z3 TaxID=3031330 RepID=UPI002478A517|nr:hypothetical protein [Rhodanobacter sp. AS-Z3]WEN15449.1 hypothetical protein PY254_01875 [Rhodanobacter sp. AS-Z3]